MDSGTNTDKSISTGSRADTMIGTDKSITSGRLTKGTRVQVRNRFDGSWSRGFEVFQSRRNGYLLRRLSDRQVLPVTFDPPDLRRESLG